MLCRSRCFFILFALLASSSGASTAQTINSYDASLNTLPQEQGWTFRGGSLNPAPSVSGGVLTINRVDVREPQEWSRADLVNDFSPTARTFFLETSIKVDRSGYAAVTGPGWRAGYHIEASDSIGRHFILGLAENGFRLSNDLANLDDDKSSPFINFDTMSGFNTYRLEVSGGTGHLYVNGDLKTSLALGATNPPQNRVLFGSGVTILTSQTQMQYLRYGVVPAPHALLTALIGMVPGVALLWRCRRSPISHR